jgi:N-methylhydantoinase A
VARILTELAAQASETLDAEDVPRADQSTMFQLDVRYHGQGLLLTVNVEPDDLEHDLLEGVRQAFDAMHTQLFTFALEVDHELVNLRAVVQGDVTHVRAGTLAEGEADVSAAIVETTTIFVDGADTTAHIYARAQLRAGNRIMGPAIVTEMDSTSLILPGHWGDIDQHGNMLIRPIN